jgi:methylenetetrahydrofolate reductase (NADPH)
LGLAQETHFLEKGFMKIIELFLRDKPVLSFELFPPKRDGNLEELFKTVLELKELAPDYMSITYGAGGSSRDLTYDIAVRLKNMDILPLMHFTCVGHSKEEICQILGRVRDAGLENILALRGDPPKGQLDFKPAPDGFRYAEELIRFIRGEGYGFCLGVAGYPEGHPEAGGLLPDMENMKRKIQAGGQFIVTQLFFENEDFFRYVDQLRGMGVNAPVQPGLWLLTDYSQVEKIGSFGTKIPLEFSEGLKPHREDKEYVRRKGIDYAVRQCVELLEKGAPGIHFYVMNKSNAVREVISRLKTMGWFQGK